MTFYNCFIVIFLDCLDDFGYINLVVSGKANFVMTVINPNTSPEKLISEPTSATTEFKSLNRAGYLAKLKHKVIRQIILASAKTKQIITIMH